MQIFKQYTGTLTDPYSGSRPNYYGGAAGSWSCLNRIDFFNQAVADFLRNECGVDAAYEARDEDVYSGAYKWLYINNVPLLYVMQGSYCYKMCRPKLDLSIHGSSTAGPNYAVFESASSESYNFGLSFVGTPDNFMLRIRPYSNNWNTDRVCFMKAESLVSGKEVSIISYGSLVSNGNLTAGAYGVRAVGIEINADKTPDWTFYGPSAAQTPYFIPTNQAIAIQYGADANKVPLIPIFIGPWKTKGLYLYPGNHPLIPTGGVANVELQPEFETADGRKFINLTNTGSSYSPCIGMIEVT